MAGAFMTEDNAIVIGQLKRVQLNPCPTRFNPQGTPM